MFLKFWSTSNINSNMLLKTGYLAFLNKTSTPCNLPIYPCSHLLSLPPCALLQQRNLRLIYFWTCFHFKFFFFHVNCAQEVLISVCYLRFWFRGTCTKWFFILELQKDRLHPLFKGSGLLLDSFTLQTSITTPLSLTFFWWTVLLVEETCFLFVSNVLKVIPFINLYAFCPLETSVSSSSILSTIFSTSFNSSTI